MTDEWVLIFRDSTGKDVRTATTSKEAALGSARALIRQPLAIERIEGPDEVLDKEAIERWVEAHPE